MLGYDTTKRQGVHLLRETGFRHYFCEQFACYSMLFYFMF